MITAKTALANIEQSAYLQALAAALAIKVVRAQQVSEYEDENAAEILLAALLLAMRRGLINQIEAASLAAAKSLGYGLLTNREVAAIVELQLAAAIDRAAPAVEAAISDIRARLELLAASGMGDVQLASLMGTQGITKALTQRVEGVAKSAATSLVKSIESATLLVAQQRKDEAAVAAGAKPLQWNWITMLDDHVCEDHFLNSCSPRHAWHMTLDNWKTNGLPQGPQLICSIYSRAGISQCRCFLVQAGSFAGMEAGPVNAAEAIRAGKERASPIRVVA